MPYRYGVRTGVWQTTLRAPCQLNQPFLYVSTPHNGSNSQAFATTRRRFARAESDPIRTLKHCTGLQGWSYVLNRCQSVQTHAVHATSRTICGASQHDGGSGLSRTGSPCLYTPRDQRRVVIAVRRKDNFSQRKRHTRQTTSPSRFETGPFDTGISRAKMAFEILIVVP